MELRTTHAIVGAVLLLFLAEGAPGAQVLRDRPAPPVAPGTAVISGRMSVMTPSGPGPVRRARVTIESDALKWPMSTDTDTDGRYRFTALPAGSFRIRGEKAGFVPRIEDVRRAFEPAAAFDVNAGQSVTVDLPMQPSAALEGRILKDNGDPAVNIVVSAVRMAYDEDGRRPAAVRQARTDDLGRFRVHTLPPGEYQVDAAPDPLDAAQQVQTPGPRLPSPSRTYYPGTPRLDEARAVAVTEGQTASNLDFTLTSVTTSSIRGKVVTSDGTPAKGPAVRLQRVGGPVGEVRCSTLIEANDFFCLNVPPGDYWLTGVARSAPGAEQEFSVTRFTVEGQDLTNVALATAKQPRVSGRVEGLANPSGLQVVAYDTAFAWPALPGDGPQKWVAPVAADGTFTFAALPGPRLLRVDKLPAGVAVTSIFIGETPVTDTPVEVKAADTPSSVRVVLTSETATIHGVVRDAAGKPVAGARVVVFGGDETAWGARSRVVKAVESGADGRYEVAGLLVGDYSIIALTFLENLAWSDAAVLRRLKTDALTLHVGAAGTYTVPLVVKP